MSPSLMSFCKNGNRQMFSSKYQEQNFCLNKTHSRAISRAVYSFRSYYFIMNETHLRKICLIMSTKMSIFLFSSVIILQASINCDPQAMVNYFYERNFFVEILLKSARHIALY
jgi:hypothetical protein